MLTGKYAEFHARVSSFLPQPRLFHDQLHRLAYGTDASFYRLIPEIVVRAESEGEIVRLLAEARALGLPLTFRAAGTSLSGQSISDSILVVLGSSWRGYRISEDASLIRLQCGVIGAHANMYLAPHGRKIGPDPASINSAMIGGIAANNASGMCCGTAQNSYRTLSSIRLILADGSLLDTGEPESRREFLATHDDLIGGVSGLARRIRENAPLAVRIREKYRMKNTTGYSLNALVDFDDPLDIIAHLMIGSEGTLGFISEVTYQTVPELPCKASALMLFDGVGTACRAVSVLKSCPVDAVELMDRTSLRSVEGKEGMPAYLGDLGDDVCALLVETRAPDAPGLAARIEQIKRALEGLPTVRGIVFTDAPTEYEKLWNIRKGLFPSVGAMRRTGTTVIIEDVAFPVPRLAEAALDLRRLFQKHGYQDAILFGHALEGNLHFVFTQDFNEASEVLRYREFIDELTVMVVGKYDGSLKAEHGTGRNMAPFVQREWGAEAYGLMKEIKDLFDPEGLINPGVIINADPEAHLKDLKPLPAAHEVIDKCIECGFCEVQCPSRDLTLTPRQRIVAYREIARLTSTGDDPDRLDELSRGYRYDGKETCATDGLCATSCPVSIDTGKLIKHLRAQDVSTLSDAAAWILAENMSGVTALVRLLLGAVGTVHRLIGTKAMRGLTGGIRRFSGNRIPLWNPYMPRGAGKTPRAGESTSGDTVVYFPSCINRSMGVSADSAGDPGLTGVTVRVLEKAGFRVIYPRKLSGLCCGMAFDSKGYRAQGAHKAKELEEALLAASNNGAIPVYVDMSPCLYHMKESLDRRLRLYEPIEFMLAYAADRLEFRRLPETVTIHTTCSSTKMGLAPHLKKLALMCSQNVVVPDGIGCCGWAGDRGFTFPELNASALAPLRSAIPAGCSGGYSTSRTCEIGLSLHSGITYKSIVYLVDRCTVGRAPTS